VNGRTIPESLELVGALEIGGTHVTSALVDVRAGLLVPGSVRRRPIDPQGAADELLRSFASAVVDAHAAPDVPSAVAIPGRLTAVAESDCTRTSASSTPCVTSI
jgi:hypothetical protein